RSAHPAPGFRGLARGRPLLAGRASGADAALASQRLRRGGRPGLVSALFGAVGHADLLGVRLHGRPVVRARPADRALRRRSAPVPDGAAAPARAMAALPGAARGLPAAGCRVRRRARDPGGDSRAALGAAPSLPQFDGLRGPRDGLFGRDVFRDPPDVGGDRCGVFAPVAGVRAGVSRVRLEGDRMASHLPETQQPPRRRLPPAQLTFEAYWLLSRHPLAYAGQIIVLSALAMVMQAVVTILVDGFTADVAPPWRPVVEVATYAGTAVTILLLGGTALFTSCQRAVVLGQPPGVRDGL